MKKYLVGTLFICFICLFGACEEPIEKEEVNKKYTIEVFEIPYHNLEFYEIHIVEFDKNNNRVCKNRIEKLSFGESKTFIAKTGVNHLKIYFRSEQLDSFLFQEEHLFLDEETVYLLGEKVSEEEYFEGIFGDDSIFLEH